MGREELPGWFDYEDVYREAVEAAPNFATFVEVGVGFGRSITCLADLAIKAHKKLRIFGVDPWYDDWDTDHPTWGANFATMGRELGGPFNAAMALMHQHAPRELEYVNLVRARSVQAARMFDDGSVFFVFVDGSHHYDDVRADLAAWQPKVAKGGIFAGHDFTDSFPDVQRAVHERFMIEGVEQRGACWFKRVDR